MRIKSDFVTNSSSTSFVISCKEKIEELKESPLLDLLQELLNIIIVNSNGDNLKELVEHYGLEETDQEYIDILEAINNGGTIIYLSVPYGGEIYCVDRFLKKYDGQIMLSDD
jgi:uncharacterized membrane protein